MSEGFFDLRSILMGGPTAENPPLVGYTPITFPLEIPPVSGVRDIIWSTQSAQGISVSPFTLKEQIQRHSGERWGATVVLPRMSKENSEQWQGFLLNLDGIYRSVLFGDVFNPSPRGTALGTPLVDGPNTSKVLSTKGWDSNQTGVLKSGDWIQINNQLLKVTRDANSNVNGEAALNVWPAVRGASNNDVIITENASGIFRQAKSNNVIFSTGINRKVNEMPTINLVEVV